MKALAVVVCLIVAFEIYPSSGWGWFLLAAILIAGSGKW